MTAPAFVVLALALSLPRHATAQAALPRNAVELHVEPIAVGIRYARVLGPRVAIGPSLTIGPFHGVTIEKEGFGQLREWATAYLAVDVSATENVHVLLRPIGAALATGDDFGAVYPSAQAGLEVHAGRLRIGTDIRALRIAGGDGTANYWLQWIPVRVGIGWRW